MPSMKAKRLEEWKKFNTYEAHGVNGDSVLEKVDKLKSILSELPTLIQEEERKKEAKAKIAVGVQEKLQGFLSAERSKLTEGNDHLEKLHQDEENSKRKLEEAQEQLEKTKAELKEITAKAKEVFDEETNFPHLQARKNLYYMVTRTHWSHVTKNEHAIKGFVVNANKTDVSPFALDRSNPTVTADILWDYIGSGISPAWPKQ